VYDEAHPGLTNTKDLRRLIRFSCKGTFLDFYFLQRKGGKINGGIGDFGYLFLSERESKNVDLFWMSCFWRKFNFIQISCDFYQPEIILLFLHFQVEIMFQFVHNLKKGHIADG
jgi:hypothetical protein